MFQFYCGKSLLNYPLNMILLLRISSTFHFIRPLVVFSIAPLRAPQHQFHLYEVHFFFLSTTPEIIIRSFLMKKTLCVIASLLHLCVWPRESVTEMENEQRKKRKESKRLDGERHSQLFGIKPENCTTQRLSAGWVYTNFIVSSISMPHVFR